VWAFFATFTTYFGGMFLAMFIKKKTFKHQALFRSLFVLTLAVPQFITLRVMYVMFNDFGPINQWLLSQTIITDRILFWSDINLAKTLIILVNMWVGIPYYMLLMSGLLLNIPKDHYEAAAIEGASRWQQFRFITFPHLLFMTSPLLITGFVGNINNFNVIWLLTGGRPLGLGTGGVAGGTDILITWLYKLTMQNNPEYNLGAAIGIIMFIFSSVISLFIFRKSSAYAREEEFQG
jgi:arabinogalactan oligomer/maltooligosaccharide transport system permease protein